MNNKVATIDSILSENKLSAEVYPEGIGVCVEISWGDWKHDHLRCDYILKQSGFLKVAEQVTEENGSDCYSSIHLYV